MARALLWNPIHGWAVVIVRSSRNALTFATVVRSSMVEPTAHNGPVAGSIPAAPTNF